MMLFSGVIGIAVLGLATGLVAGIMTVILLRRQRALRRNTVQSATRFMYSGNLKQTNMLDALQFLELGRREGILHIYVGRRKGYITFSGGQIVDAFFRDATGKEAVFQMLELDYGDFYFESKTINQPRVITESMMDIALEWDARKYGDAFGGGEEPPPYDTGMQQEAAGMVDAPPAEGYQEAPAETIPAENNSGQEHNETAEEATEESAEAAASADSAADSTVDDTKSKSGEA
jgi:hypothetical protein